jgi:hypothetical protein
MGHIVPLNVCGKRRKKMKKEDKKLMGLLVGVAIIVCAVTYMFTLSTVSTSAEESINDLCKANGFNGFEGVKELPTGFEIRCSGFVELDDFQGFDYG